MNPTDRYSDEEVPLRLSGFVGASGSFSPARLTASLRSSTLTISIARSVPPGKHEMVVIGFDGVAYASTLRFEVVVLAPQ
jgi:hypothetical protein